jgi:hypothetical protein
VLCPQAGTKGGGKAAAPAYDTSAAALGGFGLKVCLQRQLMLVHCCVGAH